MALVNQNPDASNTLGEAVGVGIRGSVGVGVGVEVDVCVCVAGDLSDGVALTVVVGPRVDLGVAVVGSTVSKSVALLPRVALLPKDAGTRMACSRASEYR
jgi:hypothetical protein